MLVPDNPRSDRVSKCLYRVDLDLIVYRNVCTRSIRSWIAIIPISLLCNPDPSQSTNHRRYRVAPDRSASISISAFPHELTPCAYPGSARRVSVVCDASDFAIGCALLQSDEAEHERVISSQPRQLKAAELPCS
ncbi:unnamed protein product [Phytophthora fragariaefolia]|uniref:Unnamed protein product n=1 Tax=Phytophthora fragariaefolia TaxID=1490495 RepID=A0A9W6Y2H7_9STRA|nr:unnamed protein product [Phytophthora fragariaefolia]